MTFKEREDVDPFFYDPDAEAEYLAEKYYEDVDRKYDEWKEEQITKEQDKMIEENEFRYYYNIGRGIYLRSPDAYKINHKKEVKDGYPNAVEVKSSAKQASDWVIKKNKIKEEARQ